MAFSAGRCSVVYYPAPKVPPATALTTAQMLLGSHSASDVPIAFTALFGILRHHVGLARNKHRFEQMLPDAQPTIENAKSICRFLARMHRRHCTTEVFDHD